MPGVVQHRQLILVSLLQFQRRNLFIPLLFKVQHRNVNSLQRLSVVKEASLHSQQSQRHSQLQIDQPVQVSQGGFLEGDALFGDENANGVLLVIESESSGERELAQCGVGENELLLQKREVLERENLQSRERLFQFRRALNLEVVDLRSVEMSE